MYQALYRKWRPQVFEDVLGQNHITDTLKNQLMNHKLSHAYLFSGTRGTGKTSTAKILSRAVNCEHPVNGNPCNECRACQTALNGSAVDIIEIDAASNNRVDDVRIIRDEVVYTPADLRYKVYIIDEAHMLTKQAFNALLKTLEEPPAHVIFIFATTEPHKFPATILSRCQRFDFKRITPYDTEKRIRQITSQDGYSITDEAIGLLARIADGSMRDALSVLDQCLSSGVTAIDFEQIARITGTSDPNFIYDFSSHILEGNLTACFTHIKTAYENGRDMERILEDLIAHFRGVLVTKTLDCNESAMEILMTTKTAFGVYAHQAKLISEERLLRYLEVLSEGISSQKYLHNPRLCVEVCITAMVTRPGLEDIKGISERLAELELQLACIKQRTMVSSAVLEPAVSEPIPQTPKAEESIIEKSPQEPSEPFLEAMPEARVEEPQHFDDFIPDYPALEEEVLPEAPVSEDTEHASVEPEPAVKDETNTEPSGDTHPLQDGEISAVWQMILEDAKKKADFGFYRIIAECKLAETADCIELLFQNEAFINIAKMNQYDSILKEAILRLTGKEVMVKFRINEEQGDDSFHQLLNKLDGFQGKVTFK